MQWVRRMYFQVLHYSPASILLFIAMQIVSGICQAAESAAPLSHTDAIADVSDDAS